MQKFSTRRPSTIIQASAAEPGPAGRRVPDFFIVGHAKSGTTALYEMLRAHPQIFMPDLKEPKFFAYEGEDVVGHIFFSPVIPRTGEAAIEAMDVFAAIARKYRLPPPFSRWRAAGCRRYR